MTGNEAIIAGEEAERQLAMSTKSAAALERMLAQRTHELEQSLQQQAATADVLKVISRSSFDLQAVLDRLVETAARLCEADMSGVTRPDDGHHRHVANYGCPPDFFSYVKTILMSPGRGSIVGRVLQEGRTVQIADVLTDTEYMQREAQRLGAFRTLLGVPLLRDGKAIGVMVLYRLAVKPFTSRQVDLLTTFADQAVIAIENARLIDEIGSRTRDIARALEEQTATAEILRAISRSPTSVEPVFECIARHAVRLCGGLFANVFRYDGELLHYVSSHEVSADFVELLRTKYPMHPDRSQVSGRVILSGSVIRLEDARADPEYDQRFPDALSWRRMLGVPLIRDGTILGAIVVAWANPGPVPKEQEELLKTFADQAIIAIEHVRLVRELEERNQDLTDALQRQTATSEVLEAISRSTFDLQTILDTLTESAASLCGAEMAAITRRDGTSFCYATNYNFPDDWLDHLKTIRLEASRGNIVGRVLLSGKIVQIDDVLADPEYTFLESQQKAGYRTLLGVPLLREGNPMGVLLLARKTVEPFTDKQIEIVSTFADQAVIAIENTRMFDEIQDKSRQLSLANSFKSRFLSAASHDLRQPLHALNLFVAQLRTATDPAGRARLVTQIADAVAAMNELFDALLDMSKLEAGVLDPVVKEFPIARILDRLETTFSGAAQEKGLRLKVVASGARVRSDFILLERMLLNLVANGVRYTERGGVLVGCRRRGRSLRLDVIDTGAGIPDSERKAVFNEFYQLEAGSPSHRGGLGLGLSIVDRLGRLLGHPVELESRINKGSRFSVVVPIGEGGDVAKDVPPPPPVHADHVTGKLVVVIDDDALVLEGMRGMLQAWGTKVVAANSAQSALAMIAGEARPPDLIISDYHLADGGTGIAAIERICGCFGAPVPAFLISGDTGPERLREVSASGYHLLHKPVAPMALRAMLNRLLGARASNEGRIS